MIFVDDLINRMSEERLRELIETDSLGELPEERKALADALVSERRAEALAGRLGVWAKETLRIALRTFAALPFGSESLEHAAETEGMPGAGLSAGLRELIRCGIVFAFRKSWGEKLYVLPADVVVAWQGRLLGIEDVVSEQSGASSIQSTGEFKPDGAQRLFDLLVFVAKRTPSFTKRGALPKKTVEALRETVAAGFDGTAFMPFGLVFPHSDVYPAEIAVLFDFAFKLGLMEERDGRLCPGPAERLSSWLCKEHAEMNRELRGLWMRLYAPTDAYSCLLLTGLLGCAEPRWQAVGSDERTLRVLAPLIELGWLEAGRVDHAVRALSAVRWRETVEQMGADSGQQKPALFVQPELELLAPPNVSWTVRWELEAFAMRVRTDHVTVYRLTKESVLSALADGRKGEHFIALLEREAKYGVPENVRQTIMQWVNAYGRVSVETVTVLRCRDAETAAEIEANPKLACCLGAKWGSMDFPVLSERQENFILLLTDAGYAPQMELSGTAKEQAFPRLTDPIIGEGNTAAIWNGFVQSTNPVHRYEFDSAAEGSDDGRMPLHDIPPMWMKEPRPYHGSTRKQMIETAIVCKAMLRLKISGVDRLLTPKRIHETGTSWMLEAFERTDAVRLDPGEWEEMQLIVPGIHDLYYT